MINSRLKSAAARTNEIQVAITFAQHAYPCQDWSLFQVQLQNARVAIATLTADLEDVDRQLSRELKATSDPQPSP